MIKVKIWCSYFHWHRVAMSVCLSVCLCHRVQFFSRPLIGPEVTCSGPGLSLVPPPSTPPFSLNRPHWADSVIESPCPSVCVSAPLGAVFFEASHWPCDPRPLIIGPGTTIRATICALPAGQYHPRYHPRYHPHTTSCALPSAHYQLLFNQMIADTKA